MIKIANAGMSKLLLFISEADISIPPFWFRYHHDTPIGTITFMDYLTITQNHS
jgi:hypothetical protein